ncbi:hypothetical protein AVEN_234615-1 [Araneus ventricosus]|uniref:DUF4371 domain-containing protein n=1 Tax=Araneus ventricosus TaxID=182803 RepID=A0A4Y2WK29_ARAVE|nr:hypothetical protein AVEN_243402-1 [Araneus ventricosus]GBO36722.1 hypothetical protein AVEN_234615-1 [Araneus ventricosus]
MKRQASIQNLFAKKQSVNRPVSDSAEVGCASNIVSFGVANTSTVDPAPCYWGLQPTDETTDISQIEQFSLCVWHVEDQLYKIREDFLTFVPVYDVTGAGLANTVLETLSSLGLDLKKMRGQGYDGAATMRGQFRGVQVSIKEKLPLDLHTHCSSHSLNLCL